MNISFENQRHYAYLYFDGNTPETCREFCKTTVAAFDGRQVTVRFRDIPADREAKRE